MLGAPSPGPVSQMPTTPLRLVTPVAPSPTGRRPEARPRSPERKALGQILVDMGALEPGDLARALAMQAREEARFADILLTHHMIGETDLMAGLAVQWRAQVIGASVRPDPRLLDRLGLERCLRDGLLPWRVAGATTVIATSRPEDFARMAPELTALFGPVAMALVSERDLGAVLLSARQTVMNRRAETLVPLHESCRLWNAQALRKAACIVFGTAAAIGVLAPTFLFALLAAWAVLTLVATAGLKLAAAVAQLRHLRRPPVAPEDRPEIARLPTVSVMVPMFNERDIAPRLVRRLGRLTYPKELLDVLLVIEEEDTVTRDALAAAALPRWMRVVVVPAGPLKTKPRALNYALSFARGSIVGIYDAEDAPEADQIHRIVRRFHERGPEVACLQGVLDYYNPRTNWLARCFTVEYASWFRMVLPGLERLGLAIPLGGTTLFFRRTAIEALGGWDAHNVTEDADLGIRLARHGYRAELVATVTEEEANCRVLPWIKQRSRWLKGYAMTYAVHMRDPGLLWHQLGPWRFFGVQVLFLGTLSQFLLAPVLWSFWLLALGLGHPLAAVLPGQVVTALTAIFIASEVINVSIGICAVSTPKHRWLRGWACTLPFYFPLGCLASYKGFWELVARPFYWDKTSHGHFDDAETEPVLAAVA